MKRLILKLLTFLIFALWMFCTAAASDDAPFQFTIDDNAVISTQEKPGDYLAFVIDCNGNSRFFTATVEWEIGGKNKVLLPPEIEKDWWKEGSALIIQDSEKVLYYKASDLPAEDDPIYPEFPEIPDIPNIPEPPDPVKPQPLPGVSDDNNSDTIAPVKKDKNSNEILTDKVSGKDQGVQFPIKDVDTGVGTQMFHTAMYCDVASEDWYYNAVVYVTEKGMMAGSGGCFSPSERMTRGMMAQILYNIEKTPATGAAAFSDVQPSNWFSAAVAWASGQGFMSGYGNGSFGPNDFITREQLAAILFRYAGAKGYHVSAFGELDSFGDSSAISDWAESSVRWAVGCGLLSGRPAAGGLCLEPVGTATRAEAAQILMNFGIMVSQNAH